MAENNSTPVSEIVNATLKNLRELVNVNAIIGDPVNLADGTCIIPISKISFGYGTGGTDIPSKNPTPCFGGGGAGGGTIEPIAFIVIHGDNIKLLQIATADNTADRVVNMIPQVFDKVNEVIDSAKAKKNAKAAASDPRPGAPEEG